MDTVTWPLIAAALIPAIALCIFIYIKDRAEKEPLGLLLRLFIFGALASVPIILCESILSAIIDGAFAPYATVIEGEMFFSDDNAFRLHTALSNFMNVAPAEEGFKLLVLYLFTRKNKNFNSLFDGLIYAIFVSLGFAALENVLYVMSYGWSVAIMRAILSVPGHMFFAVMMGYNYTTWNIYRKAAILENTLAASGLISIRGRAISSKKHMIGAFIVPVLCHGFYNYCCTVGSVISMLVFFAFVIFLYIFCFIRIHKMSKADGPDLGFASAIIAKKYPEFAASVPVAKK